MESRASQVRIVASRPLRGNVWDPLAEDAQNPTSIRLFVPQTPGREHGGSRALRIGRYILRGGGPLHHLPLIEVSKNRTCLMFQRGTRLAVGVIFDIVRPIRIRDDFARRPAAPLPDSIKALKIDIVHVLSGSVIKGYWAERVDKARIEALPHTA